MVYQGFVPFCFVVGIKDGVLKERMDPVLSTHGVLSIPNTSGELLAPLPYLLPRVRQTEIPSVPAAPCSPQKEVFLDPSCLCLFQWQGARSFSSPSSPSPWALLTAWAGKRSTNVQDVWEHWPYTSPGTKNFLCFTSLGDTLGSVQSSLLCQIFLPTAVCSRLEGTWTLRWSRL